MFAISYHIEHVRVFVCVREDVWECSLFLLCLPYFVCVIFVVHVIGHPLFYIEDSGAQTSGK